MQARITGYVRGEGSSHTYDGTPIWTGEPIAAASWNIPMDSYVEIEGIGTFRVADRGMLGSSGWIDIAVYSRSEALALTSVRTVCVLTDS
jgi:3D (Asp-Asp-Asp) domain-containing protein